MNVLTINEHIMNIFSSNNEEKIQNSLDFLNNINESLEMFSFCVFNFKSFQDIISIKFIILMIRNWCKNRWKSLCAELKEEIRRILFGDIIVNQNEINDLISDAQLFFMLMSYPNEWSCFWEELFQMSTNQIFIFIKRFASFSYDVSDSNIKFIIVKKKLHETRYDIKIIDFVYHMMCDEMPLGFSIFAMIAKWIDLNYLLSNEVISIISSGLENKKTVSFAFQIILSMIKRNIAPDVLNEIIDILKLSNIMIKILCNENDNTILFSIAKLIKSIGKLDFEINDYYIFFQIALQLFMNENDNISICAIYFLQNFILKNPEMLFIILNASYSRLVKYYSHEKIDDDCFGECIINLIEKCINLNKISSFEFIKSICQTIEIKKELLHCSALLNILNNYYRDQEMLIYFEPILNLTSPFTENKIKAIICYVQYFISVSSNADTMKSTFIFNYLVNICLLEQNNNLISKSLLSFVKNVKYFVFDSNFIYKLIDTDNYELASVSGVLFSKIYQNDKDSLCTILDFFIKNNKIISLLKFLKEIHGDNDLLFNAFERLITLAFNKDCQLLFIKACYSSLGMKSFGIITLITQKCNLSLHSICKIIKIYKKMLRNELNDNVLNVSLNYLIYVFNGYINNHIYQLIENYDLINLVLCFFEFISDIDYIPNDFLVNISNYAKDIFQENLPFASIYRACLLFLFDYIKIRPELINPYMKHILKYVILNDKFDFLSDILINIQSYLIQFYPDETKILLRQVFIDIFQNFSEDIFNEYINITLSSKTKSTYSLFTLLTKMLN